MAKIILACSQKPLAAFIETALVEFDVDCQIAVDAAGLTALIDALQPDLILLNSGFPISAASQDLLTALQDGSQVPVISISEPTEIVLADDGGEQQPDLSDVLTLPFGKNDLRQKIEKIAGLKLAEKSAGKPVLEKTGVAPAKDLLSPDSQPERSEEKDEEMKNLKAETVKTFELTEIVEEGLPLDELPASSRSGSSMIDSGALTEEAGLVGTQETGPITAADADLDFADLGDSLDDLELDLQGTPSPEAGTAETAGKNDATTLPESALLSADVNGSEVVTVEDTAVASSVSESDLLIEETRLGSASKQPKPVSGDLDALLDDDDFAEVEILEVEDPVLAGLKSAGLTPEVATPAAAERDESLPEDDLNDYEDLLDGVAAVRDEADGDPLVGETAVPEVESQEEADPAAEFVEMPRPEEVSPPESIMSDVPKVAADVAAFAVAGESEIEQPEDYIEDEEIMSEASESDLEIGTSSELHSPAPSAQMDAPTPPPIEPRVFTEPQSLDFSQQIEGMTQEWSKQLLQTTYASMDKMIKAIGDLAPTIVNQVAREVIPPLAEKVIKAEIARLEEQLKLEEGEGEEEEDSC